MANNQKPRKAYVPKAKLLPLNVRHEMKTDLPLHLAWEALGTENLGLHHIEEFLIHSEILRYAGRVQAMRNKGHQLYSFCKAILERYQAVKRFGVSGPEMVAIKAILTETIPYVRRLPNSAIHQAMTRRAS